MGGRSRLRQHEQGLYRCETVGRELASFVSTDVAPKRLFFLAELFNFWYWFLAVLDHLGRLGFRQITDLQRPSFTFRLFSGERNGFPGHWPDRPNSVATIAYEWRPHTIGTKHSLPHWRELSGDGQFSNRLVCVRFILM